MKSLLLLALVATAFISSQAIITRLTPDFFTAQWWNIRTVPENLTGVQTCAPIGLITIAPTDDKAETLTLTANDWAGDGCAGWGMPSDYQMTIPLRANSTFNDVPAEMTNDAGIVQIINNLTYWYNFTDNNTQQILWDLTLDYGIHGEKAENVTILLSWHNGAGILQVAGIAIIALLSMLVL